MNDLLGALFALLVFWMILRMIVGVQDNEPVEARRSNHGQSMQEMVDTVRNLFPHIPETSIRYDLMQSRNAEITCDNILQNGYLPTPPPEFLATLPQAAHSTSSAETTESGKDTLSRPAPNLIARFQLDSRLNEDSSMSTALDKGKAPAHRSLSNEWSTSSKAREFALQERKAQLILQARQRMLQRKASGAGKTDGNVSTSA
ncbi:hypothetical protein MVES1_002797 [Malassezia vespertilionis]|uniref:CUE domain-containing protein n=1 Tax=Malassezia vespertilionis TaxID=2020962 RepID=A0A2N1JAA9_9BASI|nr:uncharacterized protein MVES1_002797 [Malassezia vespertilionis]PKI83489.1 hypothetical protein MVES_002642 [Malassezia vespertilionis]WFD07433.1 hypothetical protein MVES1_002797 [Malassezia vespertilionis]